MITIGKLSDECSHYALPETRAALLGHAALEYFRACTLLNEYQWRETGESFFYVLLPMMHQTVELATKAIALKTICGFRPETYSHHTLKIINEFASNVSVFASIKTVPSNADLIEKLEKAYGGVRYGECYLSYDGDAWKCFVDISVKLFDDLSARTGLRFPMGVSS